MLLRQIFCCWKCWFPCKPMGYLRDAVCAYLYKVGVSFPWLPCLSIQYFFIYCFVYCLLWQIWNALLLLLRWPVRTISFNYTGDFVASASEDLFIDIVSYTCHFLWLFSKKHLYCKACWFCSSIKSNCLIINLRKDYIKGLLLYETVKCSYGTNRASDSLQGCHEQCWVES